MSRNSAQKKIFATQTNTASKHLCRQQTNQWVLFYLPVTSRGNFAQYSLHANPSVPNIQPSYHFVEYLTIILRNRAEYHLILSQRGRRPSWLNQGIFRKIEQDNCFIIQQIPIFKNEKNYGSMMKTLKASNT